MGVSQAATGRLARVESWVNGPALLAVLLWGGMVPFTKYALGEFPVMTYTALRSLGAAAILFAFVALRGQPLGVDRADWRRLLIAGLAGQGFFHLFTLLGLQYTSATHNILLFSTSPIVGAAILWAFRRYRPTRRVAFGILLGFAGVAMLVHDAGAIGGGSSLFGDALTLIGTLGWVVLTVVPGPLTRRYGAILVTAWMQALATLAVLPFALGELGRLAERPPSWLPWLSLLYSVVLGSVVAYSLWQRAARELGPTGTLIYVYLEPLVTIALAIPFLGERLDAIQALGAVVLLAGVGLAQRRTG